MSGGIKHDTGKPDPTFLSWDMVEAISQVRAFGAVKYSPFNWMKGFKYRRSAAAALRHIFLFLNGEDMDKESGLSHIAHAICCLEHLLYDFKHNPKNDDRYKADETTKESCCGNCTGEKRP